MEPKLTQFKLTKSKLLKYLTCPLLYKRTEIDEIKQPSSSQMNRGTKYHQILEEYLKVVDIRRLTGNFNKDYVYIRSLLPDEEEFILDNIAVIEAQRAMCTNLDFFKPIASEEKFETMFCPSKYEGYYSNYIRSNITDLLTEKHLNDLRDDYNIVPSIRLTGIVDYLYKDADLKYRVHEFKTGSFNASKQTRVRKELVLYKKLIDPHMDQPVEKISYFFADERDIYVEDILKRTETGLKNSIFTFIKSHMDREFKPKYYGNYCDKYCQFADDCKLLSHYRGKL